MSQQDRAVQTGDAVRGQEKEGPQTHVHVLVSRTENLTRYQERKQSGDIDRKNPLKLSPATHHRNTNQGAVKGGFDRRAFKEAAEQTFDRQFDYERAMSETFAYANVMDKGSHAERVAMRQAAQEQSVAQRQVSVTPVTTTALLGESTSQQPQIESAPAESIEPKLSDREELIRTMLARLNDPLPAPQQGHRQSGLSL